MRHRLCVTAWASPPVRHCMGVAACASPHVRHRMCVAAWAHGMPHPTRPSSPPPTASRSHPSTALPSLFNPPGLRCSPGFVLALTAPFLSPPPPATWAYASFLGRDALHLPLPPGQALRVVVARQFLLVLKDRELVIGRLGQVRLVGGWMGGWLVVGGWLLGGAWRVAPPLPPPPCAPL